MTGDLSDANVGLYATNGGLKLSISRGGDVWFGDGELAAPPTPELMAANQRAMNALLSRQKVRMPDGNGAEYSALLRDKYHELDAPSGDDIKLGGWANRRVSLAAIKPREYVAPFLKALHDQTGIAVVADGLLFSSQSIAPLERDARNQTLYEACADLCVHFRRSMRTRDGWLQVTSRRYAVYRLYEPPHATVAGWLKRRNDQGQLTFDDLAEMAAALSPQQIETLGAAPRSERALQAEAEVLRRHIAVFRLWNRLPADQRRLLCHDGLVLEKIGETNRADFWRIACSATQSPGAWRPARPAVRFVADTAATEVLIGAHADERSVCSIRLPPMKGTGPAATEP